MGTPFIGEIRLFAGNFPPIGWAFCDGQLLPISENDALFTLIGTTYGGDGQNTFALPDLRGRTPVHQGGAYVIGQLGGQEAVGLTLSQMPNHTHTVLASGAAGTDTTPNNNVPAAGVANIYDRPPDTALASGIVGQVGGGQPHANMQPYMAINYIISLFGLYPTPF